MCDYSLQHVRSRPAKVDDQLITKDFGRGTTGFACQRDKSIAVCLLPGTELAFEKPIRDYSDLPFVRLVRRLLGKPVVATAHTTASFRQINRHDAWTHHDALEFPDGKLWLLTSLAEGQRAVVLQLPAAPRSCEEEEVSRQARLKVPVNAVTKGQWTTR